MQATNVPQTHSNDDERLADMYDKQSMLLDLQRIRKVSGIPLSREWSMNDDSSEMAFELKRLSLHVDETNNVAMMRNGLQLACTGIEMMSKRMGVLDLNGWSKEACRDMAKYDRGLGRLYRKYWKRSFAANPETDIAMSLVSSMGMYHLRKKMTSQIVRPAPSSSSARLPIESDGDSSDDEAPPPVL